MKKWITMGVAAGLCVSCATTEMASKPDHDTLEPVNRTVFVVNDTIDKVAIKPIAQGYQAVTPNIMRSGVSNFFSNLNDVVVMANDLLQLDLIQAVKTSSRIVYNSTFGLLGLIDVSTAMNIPKRPNDFGMTLARWGIAEGPYIELPLAGPSTARDTVGLIVDGFANPLSYWGESSERNAAFGLDLINSRASLLRTEKVLDAAALDRYTFRRDAYLQYRRGAIYERTGVGSEPSDSDLEEGDFDGDGEVSLKEAARLERMKQASKK